MNVAPGSAPAQLAHTPQVDRFDRRSIIVGGILFAVLMALSGRYGFHRDELYFLDCARHLQGGYVDQPVLTPLLARVSLWLFGTSVPGLRLWPALAGCATVIVSALLAREFGGGRRAQMVTAIAVATTPILLGAGRTFSTTSLDLLVWAGLALVAVRVERTSDTRWWLLGGLILGVGLANKHSVGFFAVALAAGALMSGGRALVANRWFVAGAAIAALCTVPDLWWQAQHGWATIAMTHALNQENGGLGKVGTWIVGQLVLANLVLVWVWAAGLRFLWRPGRPMWRALAWSYGLLFVFFAFTSGSKTYYLAGTYIYLLPAGIVAIDGWLAARPHRARRLLVAIGLNTALTLPLLLPVLPASDIAWTYKSTPELGETVGWPQLVHTVAAVWASLPPAQRANAVIYTDDYSEHGAIDELGKGLPKAVGGQNSDWWWGPGNSRATTVVMVTPGVVDLAAAIDKTKRYFTDVRPVAVLSNPDGVHNIEWGGHILLCTGPRLSWTRIWPHLRHYD